MSLLIFAIVALMIGADLRLRGRALSYVTGDESVADAARTAVAAGGWISFAGGICLNIAVWQLF